MRYFISLIGLAAIVGAGYFALAQYTNVAYGQSGLVADSQNSGDATNPDGVQVLAWLNRLQSIRLKADGKVLSSANFTALIDRSVAINPQVVGRPNPYLPTYTVAPAASSTPKVSLQRSR